MISIGASTAAFASGGGATIQQPLNGSIVSGSVAIAVATAPRVNATNVYIDGSLYASAAPSNLIWDFDCGPRWQPCHFSPILFQSGPIPRRPDGDGRGAKRKYGSHTDDDRNCDADSDSRPYRQSDADRRPDAYCDGLPRRSSRRLRLRPRVLPARRRPRPRLSSPRRALRLMSKEPSRSRRSRVPPANG